NPSEIRFDNLPMNSLATQNMSTVLMAVNLLQPLLAVKQSAIITGLTQLHLPGRIQVIHGKITEIFDVSHNPDAVGHLFNYVNQMTLFSTIEHAYQQAKSIAIPGDRIIIFGSFHTVAALMPTVPAAPYAMGCS